MFFIGGAFGFLFGPLLYFYTAVLTNKNYKFTKVSAIHLAPFLIYNLIYIIFFHSQSVDVKQKLLITGSVLPTWIGSSITPLMHVQILIYIILCIVMLNRYGKEIKNLYSEIDKLNLSWLKLTLFAFIFMWLVDAVQVFLFRVFEIEESDYLTILSLTINFVFANVIIFKGLKHPEFFNGIEAIQKPKYEKSSLKENEADEYLRRLNSIMDKEKPYLTPSVTINDLADKTGIHCKYLSQIINEKMNQNFFDFINYHRINEAKKILSNPENKKLTVLEILYEVGFNSKSVFNSAFKKYTGMTPTEFRNSFLN
jgi:AraC-like DNA-binding protein